MSICPRLARGSRPLTEGRRTMRTSTPRGRDCGRCPLPRATSSLGAPGASDPAGSLAVGVALQTVHRRVHATPRLHQVSEKDFGEAAVVEDVPDPAGSHGTGADVFAHEPWTGRRELHPELPIDSRATGARQRPGGASDKLGGSRQVVRRASTTEEATLVKGHHAAQLLGATACETPFGLVVAHQVHVQTTLAALQLQPRAKRAADGVTEAVRALGRGELHTERGSLLLKKQLVVDILLACAPRIARLCRLAGVLQLAYGRLPSKPHARPGGVQGGRATPLRPGCPGSSRRRSSQPRPMCSH